MENLKLQFEKPLAFIKVQTTGLNSKTDRIIQLTITRVEKDGSSKVGTRYINPEVEISSEITNINGITNELVKSKPTFKEIAPNLIAFLEGCDFVGFNIGNFDLKFLSEEFNRAGVEFTLLTREVIDIARIYHAMEPRDLSAAYQFYCGKSNESKGDSQKVTDMYFEIVNKMIEKYVGQEVIDKTGKTQKIESTVKSINTIFNPVKKQLDISGGIVMNDEGVPVFSFGKYGPKDGVPGQPVGESLYKDPTYCDWLINASNFAPDTKLVAKRIVSKYKAKVEAKTA